MLRQEFQDGTHKNPTQDYHGSGRAHIHWALCAEHPHSLQLHDVASASLDHEPHLQSFVINSQLDRNRQTTWPIHEGESYWSEADQCTYLHHSAADHEAGVRGFFKAGLEVIPSHEDLQEIRDYKDRSAYLCKYPFKMSDSNSDDWWNDAHGGDALAQSILFRYKPFEPEMVLQLFGHRFRQWRISTISGGKRSFRVPVPDDDPMPQEVQLYVDCPWRGSLSLLEFLRRQFKMFGEHIG
eukprot:12415608-Karenia_brevis.AAC.1